MEGVTTTTFRYYVNDHGMLGMVFFQAFEPLRLGISTHYANLKKTKTGPILKKI